MRCFALSTTSMSKSRGRKTSRRKLTSEWIKFARRETEPTFSSKAITRWRKPAQSSVAVKRVRTKALTNLTQNRLKNILITSITTTKASKRDTSEVSTRPRKKKVGNVESIRLKQCRFAPSKLALQMSTRIQVKRSLETLICLVFNPKMD